MLKNAGEKMGSYMVHPVLQDKIVRNRERLLP